MYAIIEAGGRQWRVETGSRLDINRVAGAAGQEHTVEQVLLANDGRTVQVGRPYVAGAKVVCEVVEHRLGPKEISYHYRRRENWRNIAGHRQPLTRLLVKEIVLPGGMSSASETREADATPKASKPARPARTEGTTSVVKRSPKQIGKPA